MKFSKEVAQAAKDVTLLAMDCDGVLTDGRLYFNADGECMKAFHVHDGQGIVSWLEAGFKCAVISGRSSEMLSLRAKELGIAYVVQGARDKADEIRKAADDLETPLSRVAFVGDDLGDIPAMKLVGFPVAVGDAASAVKSCAAYVTSRNGGQGAIRELADLLFSVRDLAAENKG